MKLKHLKGAVSSTKVPKRNKYNHFGINYDNSRLQDNYSIFDYDIFLLVGQNLLGARFRNARFFLKNARRAIRRAARGRARA